MSETKFVEGVPAKKRRRGRPSTKPKTEGAVGESTISFSIMSNLNASSNSAAAIKQGVCSTPVMKVSPDRRRSSISSSSGTLSHNSTPYLSHSGNTRTPIDASTISESKMDTAKVSKRVSKAHLELASVTHYDNSNTNNSTTTSSVGHINSSNTRYNKQLDSSPITSLSATSSSKPSPNLSTSPIKTSPINASDSTFKTMSNTLRSDVSNSNTLSHPPYIQTYSSHPIPRMRTSYYQFPSHHSILESPASSNVNPSLLQSSSPISHRELPDPAQQNKIEYTSNKTQFKDVDKPHNTGSNNSSNDSGYNKNNNNNSTTTDSILLPPTTPKSYSTAHFNVQMSTPTSTNKKPLELLPPSTPTSHFSNVLNSSPMYMHWYTQTPQNNKFPSSPNTNLVPKELKIENILKTPKGGLKQRNETFKPENSISMNSGLGLISKPLTNMDGEQNSKKDVEGIAKRLQSTLRQKQSLSTLQLAAATIQASEKPHQDPKRLSDSDLSEDSSPTKKHRKQSSRTEILNQHKNFNYRLLPSNYQVSVQINSEGKATIVTKPKKINHLQPYNLPQTPTIMLSPYFAHHNVAGLSPSPLLANYSYEPIEIPQTPRRPPLTTTTTTTTTGTTGGINPSSLPVSGQVNGVDHLPRSTQFRYHPYHQNQQPPVGLKIGIDPFVNGISSNEFETYPPALLIQHQSRSQYHSPIQLHHHHPIQKQQPQATPHPHEYTMHVGSIGVDSTPIAIVSTPRVDINVDDANTGEEINFETAHDERSEEAHAERFRHDARFALQVLLDEL